MCVALLKHVRLQIMNVSLDDSTAVSYFTDMKTTLDAAEIKTTDFEWYVSDLETNYALDALPASTGWMSGQQLEEVLATPDLQFIWAIFSAFPRGTKFEVAEEPSADGNPQYWLNANLKPQLPGALFEVVSWDGSAILLVGVPEHSGLAFMHKYPQAKLHPAFLAECLPISRSSGAPTRWR
jgi:hypothetical protein